MSLTDIRRCEPGNHLAPHLRLGFNFCLVRIATTTFVGIPFDYPVTDQDYAFLTIGLAQNCFACFKA